MYVYVLMYVQYLIGDDDSALIIGIHGSNLHVLGVNTKLFCYRTLKCVLKERE